MMPSLGNRSRSAVGEYVLLVSSNNGEFSDINDGFPWVAGIPREQIFMPRS